MSWLGKKRAPPIRSLVGESTVVSGSLRFRDGLRIDGQVTGDVIAEGEGRSILVISDNALVHGRVSASHVIISGEAQDQGLEGQFRQNLMDSKVPAFDGLIWDTPNSRPQSDGRNTFDWQASPPVAEES
jgi:hypothetical protein